MLENLGESWQKSTLRINSKISDAVQVLNDTGSGIVLVIGAGDELIGTITDGDIRRGLLGGLNLDSPIQEIVHLQAIVVDEMVRRNKILTIMIENKIRQVPILNKDRKVVGLHLWDDLHIQQLRPNTMMIMAGGRGSRLYPETETCPKPLLKIHDKPILQHIIERAKSEGIQSFIISLHYLGQMIKDYFGDGDKFGVSIKYLEEEIPLGTAGALSLIDLPLESDILVTNGDVITEIKYGDILDYHKAHSAFATMAVKRHEFKNPFGVVKVRNFEIYNYEEKPVTLSQINAGVYVLTPPVLKLLTKGVPCDMSTLFQYMIKESHKVVAYPIYEDWLDVGSPNDLEVARNAHQQKVENGI
jgi:dTDP-glucose pyrophosphorylase